LPHNLEAKDIGTAVAAHDTSLLFATSHVFETLSLLVMHGWAILGLHLHVYRVLAFWYSPSLGLISRFFPFCSHDHSIGLFWTPTLRYDGAYIHLPFAKEQRPL